jgi:fibronectin-binding autotransporter adhesin
MKSVFARRARLGACLTAILFGATPLLAVDKTWVGGSNVWSLDSNWSSTEPTTADKAIFPATLPAIPGNATIDLAVGELANALQFDNNYTLGLLPTTTGTLTLTTNGVVVSTGSTGTINAILGGTAGLAVTGGGTLVLNRTGNTFTGNVTVDGVGTTLAVVGVAGSNDQTALGAAGGRSVTLTNGATFSLIGTADFNPSANTKSIVVGATGGIISSASGRTITLDDAGQFSGTGNLTKAGAGVLLIDNQSFTYTGTAVAVNEGTLRLGRNANVLGTGTVALTVASGAVLDLQAPLAGAKSITVGGTGISGAGALINSSATVAGSITGGVTMTSNLTVGGAGNVTIGGAFSDGGSNFTLTKIGAGSFILNGTNSWGGNTLVSGGAIRGTLPATGNLELNGGSYEAVANYNGTLGTGAGQVQLSGGASGVSSGLAAGVTATFNSGAALVWGSTANFNPTSLVLGSITAAGNLDFQNAIDLNGATRTFTSNATPSNTIVATLSGAITGTGGFTKTGTGVIALGNTSNAYTGTTLVSGGSLRAALGSTIPATSNLTLNGGVFESATNVTASLGTTGGQIQLTGGTSGFSAASAAVAVNLGGAGATLQYVTGSSFIPSTLIINAASATGTLDFQNGLDLNGATRTLAGNGTGTNIGTISGVIGNTSATAAGITINGTGVLALSGTNTYNGPTTFTAGSLRITSAGNLGSGAATNNLVFAGGTLQIAGTTPVDLGTRTLAVNSGSNGTVEVQDAANTVTVLGVLTAAATGNTTLNKSGPGTLKFAGTNTNVVNLLNLSGGGVLDLGDSTLQVNNGGTNTIRSTSGTNTINASGTGKIQLTVSDGDAGASNGATLIINAPITGAFRYENYPGVASGTGVTVLNSLTSDFSGGVAVNSGVLSVPKIGNSGAVGPLGTGGTIVLSVGTLRYTGTGEDTNKTININATTAVLENNGGSAATPLKFISNLTVGNNQAKTFTISGTGIGELAGIIPNNTAATSISKTGAGTWTLSAANTYTGSTTITAGVLSASAGNNLGTGTVVMDGGTLQVTGTAFNDLGARALTLTASKVMSFDIVDAANTFTLPTASVLTTAQQLTKAGAGTLKLSSGAQTVSAVNVNGGTVDLNGSTLTMSSGGGNALLGGANNATINNGSILLNAGTAGTFTGYSDNSSLTGTTLTINAKLSGTGGLEYFGAAGRAGIVQVTNPLNDFAMDVTIESPGSISTPAFGMAGVASPLGKGTAFRLNNAAGARYIYTGPGESTNRVLTLGNTGTLENNGTGLLKLTANVNATGANVKTLTLQGTGPGEIAGILSNNSGTNTTGIIKDGTGSWTLSGANSYTGATAINAGKLLYNGTATAASNVTVNAAGTIGGTGAITGTVSLAGGTISPGSSIETLATGNNVWNAGTFIFETQTDGTGGIGPGPTFNYDALNITGSLNLTALNTTSNRLSLNIVSMSDTTTPGLLSSFDSSLDHTWAGFVTTTTGITGFDQGKFNIDTTGFQNAYGGGFSVVQNGNNLDLVYVAAIPEPGTWALLTMSGLGLCYLRQRRRKQA